MRRTDLRPYCARMAYEEARRLKMLAGGADFLAPHRFSELEPAIAKDSRYSYMYALNILGGRFRQGELAISTSAYDSFYYAIDIIHGRFELAEPTIFGTDYSEQYQKLFRVHLKPAADWTTEGF